MNPGELMSEPADVLVLDTPAPRGAVGLGAFFGAIIRTFGGLIGLAAGVALTFFKLEVLAVSNGWLFQLDGWNSKLAQVLQRNIAQIQSDQWPSVWVILLEGLVAAAAVSIVVSYTVNNVSQRISNIWQFMRPVALPKDVVRADVETREWVNRLTAKESKAQRAEIDRLKNENNALQVANERLAIENSSLKITLKSAVEQLRANDRVFVRFENFASAFQRRIQRLREKQIELTQ